MAWAGGPTGQSPGGPPVDWRKLRKRMLRGAIATVLVVVLGYGILIATWVVLNPRW